MFADLELWQAAWQRRKTSSDHLLGLRHVMLCLCTDGPELQDLPSLEPRAPENGSAAPKHTIFLSPDALPPAGEDASLVAYCRATGSEIELQAVTASGGSAEALKSFTEARNQLHERSLLSHDGAGAACFAVHRSSARTQSSAPHPQGLREAGCYAEFAAPALRSREETLPLPRIYYRSGDALPRSRRVRSDRDARGPSDEELLTIEQPLSLDWTRRRMGLLPALERGWISEDEPLSPQRLRLWIDCKISLEGRPNWLFLALPLQPSAGHRAAPRKGNRLREFQEMIAAAAETDRTVRFHYVTARELVNIIHAAEAGHSGDPSQFRDFRYHKAPTLSGDESS
jgi:hypothetical protein